MLYQFPAVRPWASDSISGRRRFGPWPGARSAPERSRSRHDHPVPAQRVRSRTDAAAGFRDPAPTAGGVRREAGRDGGAIGGSCRVVAFAYRGRRWQGRPERARPPPNGARTEGATSVSRSRGTEDFVEHARPNVAPIPGSRRESAGQYRGVPESNPRRAATRRPCTRVGHRPVPTGDPVLSS